MRRVVWVVVCVGLAFAAAGCSDADKHYFKEGVGANLYSEAAVPVSDDIAGRTDLQRAYITQVCEQAGLHPSDCEGSTSDPNVWSQFVQAGMNDIDQRCDAYLTWLDNVRRARAPAIKEIADAQTATTIIMQQAGVSATPIAIAAAAFGFAANTFTNVEARLVLEVDRATVQTIVLNRQKQYREQLFGVDPQGRRILITSRPAAIFALRSYLRLCMPMTIETEINNTVATFERGGARALANSEPMISARTVGVTVISHVATDQSRKSLRDLLIPKGATRADPELLAYVKRLLGNPNLVVGPILIDARFAILRQKLAACIVARQQGQPCADGSLKQFIQ